MKFRYHSFSIIVIALLIAIFSQSGCRENTLIHSRVLPANDTVAVKTYAISCVTHSYYDNDAITSTNFGGIPIYQGVGVYTDSFFGNMAGATYFQVSFGGFAGNPFADYTIDSAILVLPYSGFTFGDSSNTSLTQTYQVFYMLDSLGTLGYVDYFPTSKKPIDVADPLSDPVTVNLHNLVASFDTSTQPVYTSGLRIKLRLPSLLRRLAPALNSISSSNNLPQDFFNAFHGVCVMPANTTQGTTAIPYFRLDGSNQYSQAGILVYYHDPNVTPAPTIDTVPAVYGFDASTCSHFNSITRSYSRYPVNNLLNSAQANDSIIVMQNQPGAGLDIIIPGIKSIPQGIINNAQLQISLLPASRYQPNSNLPLLPERLYAVGIGSGTYPSGIAKGYPYNLADRYPVTSLSPLSYLDGFYHYITSGSTLTTTYTINIPREIMASIAAGNDTLHLHINGTQDFYGAFKMMAAGGSYHDSLYRPKLIVVYSKLN